MKAAALIAVLFSINAGNPGPAERAYPPHTAEPNTVAPAPASLSQLPLLFIVDGVRYPADQVPLLSAELVATVKVVKGRRALDQYGPEASYGVVVITTKFAGIRRS